MTEEYSTLVSRFFSLRIDAFANIDINTTIYNMKVI